MRHTLAVLLCLTGCSSEQPNIRRLYPEITIAPGSIDYGDVVVDRGDVREVFVTNAGRATLEVDLSLTGDDAFSLETRRLELAGSTSEEPIGEPVPITFVPGNFLDYSATLHIESNDEETPSLQVQLTGRGIDAPEPNIVLSTKTLDFGIVDQGSQLSDVIMIANTGLEPLEITRVTLEGADAFSLTSDPSGQVIAPDADYPLIVSYWPDDEEGDHAVVGVESTDPDEPRIEALVLGNGGGGLELPEAIIDCPGEAAPPEWITLDGSRSTDPLGGPLIYFWSLLSAPEGSQSHLSQLITEETDLWVDLGGDYEVQLQVVNGQGTTSQPTVCLIDAVPADALHIELTWDTNNNDLDLHLLENTSAALFDTPADCNFCNPNPSWGANGPDDDPRLDLDDRSDGPENINILEPEDNSTFPIKVHYFSGTGPVVATVTVYVRGEPTWTGSRSLKYNEVWDVGTVDWPSGDFNRDNSDNYDAPRRSCR